MTWSTGFLERRGRRKGASTFDSSGARATVTFQGIEVTATNMGLWHVEAAGRSASAAFLDDALERVLPKLNYEEQYGLLIQLLVATAAEGPC